MVIVTSRHYRWLKLIVKVVLLLNLLDAVFTLYWVHAGLAEEANVLLQNLVNDYAVLFVMVKTSLVSLASYLLWLLRENPRAVVAIFIAFFAYYLILLYHMQFLGYLLDNLWPNGISMQQALLFYLEFS